MIDVDGPEPTLLPLALAEVHRATPVGVAVVLRLPADDRTTGLVGGAGFEVGRVGMAKGGRMRVDATRARTLPDIVGPGMRVLVCGLNPSLVAADAGYGYAGRTNRFWPAAVAAGLVSRPRDPLHALAEHGVGMTDLVKRATPGAAVLTTGEYRAGAERVSGLVAWLRPALVLFVGLAGWRAAVDRRAVPGMQARPFGGKPAYVMPSTSGLNAHSRIADLTAHLAWPARQQRHRPRSVGALSDEEEQQEDQQEEQAGERPRLSRRTIVLLVAPIVLLTAMGTIATALTPTLAANHPLLLIAMDSRNRMLVLAREVDLVPFMVVGVLRRSLSDPLFYLLGRFYGEGAIRWLEKKGGGGGLVPLTEKIFKRAGYAMVFAFPGAIVCALAGTTGMSPVGFLIANLAGTLASVIAVRIFSDAISSPVEGLLDFFDRNMVATTSVTIVLVVLSLVLNRAQGKLEGASIDELEKELEAGDPKATETDPSAP